MLTSSEGGAQATKKEGWGATGVAMAAALWRANTSDGSSRGPTCHLKS
ncbi:hypothetical protein CHELA41_20282 [Hyphomicrobiales bacterium]|nr:hypothetical protein CHELA41_20282 [Hyphomicrobiales bacterium]